MNLSSVKLAMNDGFNDEALILIANNCCNLKILDISWCNHVKNKGLYMILVKCPYLEEVTIVGLKNITDLGFPLISNIYSAIGDKDKIYNKMNHFDIRNLGRNIEHQYKDFAFYKNLKKIDTSKCDFIPDETLLMIKLLNPLCEVLNYYNESLNFCYLDY